MKRPIAAVVIWVICGVLAYGICFGYLQRKFPDIAEEEYRRDMGTSVLFGFGGPITLSVLFFMTGFAEHGLKFK